MIVQELIDQLKLYVPTDEVKIEDQDGAFNDIHLVKEDAEFSSVIIVVVGGA